jgi:hypothetical protein
MKVNEIIAEGKKTPTPQENAEAAVPDARDWEDLNQNNDGYLQYRFGIAMAGAPDPQYMSRTATHQNLITIGYTDADNEILDAARKALGVKAARRLTSKKSEEPSEINQVSVVAPRKKNKYGV